MNISNKLFFVMKRCGRAAFDNKMVYDGCRALVALSGGPASSAMLLAMQARISRTPISYTLVPIHVADGLRGDEDALSATLKTQCDNLGLNLELLNPCHGTPDAPIPYRHELLAAARRLQCTTILLGHNLLDATGLLWAGMVHESAVKRLPWVEEADGVLIGRPLLTVLPEPLLDLAISEGLSAMRRPGSQDLNPLTSLLRRYASSVPGRELERLKNLASAPGNVKDEYLA